MKILKVVILIMAFISLSTTLSTGQDRISPETIGTFFMEIKANTDKYKDLWNRDLYGSILLVDPKSRIVYSNYPDTGGILKRDGEIYSGVFPNNVNIANTAINWSGKSWAMIMLPLPEDKMGRLDLLSHELFHRSQPALGFVMDNPSNNHLDQKEGRVYLRLELEALRQALMAKSNEEQNRSLTNALYFRNHRYSIYQDAKSSENSLELNEGLATYTGIFMSGRDNDQLEDYFENQISLFLSFPTFVRSFAYLTTPLYGIILSKSDKYWNKQIDSKTNLTDFFVKSFNLSVPDTLDEEILNQYGLSKVYIEETKREERIQQLISEYKTIFIEQPHLEIRFEKLSISFDPRNIMPLEEYGTVYPTIRVSDNWGILTASKGALLSVKWDKITVSEPTIIEKDKIAGNGWTIELNGGYYVEKNTTDGNYSLKKQQ